MIPTGQESRKETSAERDIVPSPVRGLVAAIRELAETAETDLPPSAKLELLIVQIGTARFWADQISEAVVNAGRVPAPHFDAAERASARLVGGHEE